LGKAVVVSFEGNDVKIIHALRRRNSVRVERTEIIADEELDGYLQRERETEFTVICDFKESYHDVLVIPVLKPRYLEKIIEAEIRKATGKRDFTFVYSPLGERVINNRKMLEIFYFMVSNETIRKVMDRFYKHGKFVKALYPLVFTAAALLNSGSSTEANLNIIGTGKERIVFFTKNGALNFIRNYESSETDFTDFDIQNINMTINYCYQNLRAKPSSVMLLGELTELSPVHTQPIAPLAALYKAEKIQCTREIFDKFFLSIASLYVAKSVNILSNEFKKIRALRHFTVYASRVFILLAVLCLGSIFYEANDTLYNRKQMQSVVSNQSDMEAVYADYLKREEDLSKDGSSFLVSVNGTGFADTYSSFQTLFDNMINKLEKLKNVEIEHKAFNLMDKSFKIEFYYSKKE
jgi:hypothetical protein